jgi:aspartate carbamoyltransferase catalytic subunit
MKHLLSVLNLTKSQILLYIEKAEIFKQANTFYDKMKNRTLINIFSSLLPEHLVRFKPR